jgi:hypothetical protein
MPHRGWRRKLLWFSGRHLELANAVAVIEVD